MRRYPKVLQMYIESNHSVRDPEDHIGEKTPLIWRRYSNLFLQYFIPIRMDLIRFRLPTFYGNGTESNPRRKYDFTAMSHKCEWAQMRFSRVDLHNLTLEWRKMSHAIQQTFREMYSALRHMTQLIQRYSVLDGAPDRGNTIPLFPTHQTCPSMLRSDCCTAARLPGGGGNKTSRR